MNNPLRPFSLLLEFCSIDFLPRNFFHTHNHGRNANFVQILPCKLCRWLCTSRCWWRLEDISDNSRRAIRNTVSRVNRPKVSKFVFYTLSSCRSKYTPCNGRDAFFCRIPITNYLRPNNLWAVPSTLQNGLNNCTYILNRNILAPLNKVLKSKL